MEKIKPIVTFRVSSLVSWSYHVVSLQFQQSIYTKSTIAIEAFITALLYYDIFTY